ncbi:MAG: 4-carboxy-4-hydroxy-2-oxoadipate aldolase/oxaloacetate decarboxylase [Desulfohalobiaceae bacterium]|nr:4-carboxy-4-hydroxy-2-oxoadipate aldolase/oxaloacetate decarboxylase [Desulfohalobiaceae bacterium]
MYLIKDDFERPEAGILEVLSTLSTPNVSDALGRFGGMDSNIRSLFKGVKVTGPAYTVMNYSKDNLMAHYALKYANPGDVLVVTQQGSKRGSGWGELMSLAAKVKGLAGLVIDGPVRDVSELEEIGFPIFSNGVMAEGTVKKNPGAVNYPVCCGGQAVSPGDVILGDDDGVVVIPFSKLEKTVQKAKSIEENEVLMKKRILSGESIYDILGLGKYLNDI